LILSLLQRLKFGIRHVTTIGGLLNKGRKWTNISGYFGTTVRDFPARTGIWHSLWRWDLQSLDFALVDF